MCDMCLFRKTYVKQHQSPATSLAGWAFEKSQKEGRTRSPRGPRQGLDQSVQDCAQSGRPSETPSTVGEKDWSSNRRENPILRTGVQLFGVKEGEREQVLTCWAWWPLLFGRHLPGLSRCPIDYPTLLMDLQTD